MNLEFKSMVGQVYVRVIPGSDVMKHQVEVRFLGADGNIAPNALFESRDELMTLGHDFVALGELLKVLARSVR